jgi:hypothetical protein
MYERGVYQVTFTCMKRIINLNPKVEKGPRFLVCEACACEILAGIERLKRC